MRNVLLLPGTDAIEMESYRHQAFEIPEVQALVANTQYIIKENYQLDLDLSGYMVAPNDPSTEGFQKLVLCSLATQVALCEKFEKEEGNILGILGLSLGDVARSVVCGICSYEDGVRQLFEFTRYNHLVKNGLTIQIKLCEPNTLESLKLSDFDLEMSIVQNDNFFLVSGETLNVLNWSQEVGIPNIIKFRTLYPFPLHCSLMQPVADKIAEGVNRACQINNLKYKIFSTVFAKEISSIHEIVKDCRDNIASTLYFTDTVRYILQKYPRSVFINVGPAPTLKYFIEKMSLVAETPIVQDYFIETINSNVNLVRA